MIPKKNDKLAWRVIDNETIVIPLANQPEDGQKVSTLNETGTRIWELIDNKNSEEDLIQKIIKEYNVSPKKASVEVKRFLKILSQKQLII